MSRPDARPTLAWIKCPTLVLTVTRTTPFRSLSVEMADGIHGAKLVILSNCGTCRSRTAAGNRGNSGRMVADLSCLIGMNHLDHRCS